MVQRYEQTRKLQWYKRGAAYAKNGKIDEGRWRVVKGWILPFILKSSVFISIPGEKMKGEG